MRQVIEMQGAVRIDGKPFVIVTLDGKPIGQITPAEALNYGIRAIQASQEAERDAALILGMKAAGFTDVDAAGMLAMIRDHRGQVDPDPREDHHPR